MAKAKKVRSITYGAYRFRDKDPSIDELRTVVEDHFGRRVNNKDLGSIATSGGPAGGTMASWFFGKTRRPQSATLEAAGRAIGYKRKWVKMT
jgi:hypothetical protein